MNASLVELDDSIFGDKLLSRFLICKETLQHIILTIIECCQEVYECKLFVTNSKKQPIFRNAPVFESAL
jgi:hypothetical protein